MKKKLQASLLIIFTSFILFSCNESATPNFQTGSVAFWTDTVPTNGIKIYIDGEIQGEISTYLPIDRPGCGEQGTLTLELEEGNYDYVAYQRDYFKWSGTLNVSKGGCTNLLLN